MSSEIETSLRVEALLAQVQHRDKDAVIARVSGSNVEEGYLLLEGDYHADNAVNPDDIRAEAWPTDGSQLQVELATEEARSAPAPQAVLTFIHTVIKNHREALVEAVMPASAANREIAARMGIAGSQMKLSTGQMTSYI